METKANHLMIGSFVLAMMVALIAFTLWLARAQISKEFAYYDIFFEGSVAGLSVAGDVRYNGVYVGKVKRIAIVPDDPNHVRVTVEIAADTPIRADSVASLEFQGLTGVSFVQIDGGSTSAQPLPIATREPYPIIQSKQSALAEVFTNAPDLVNQLVVLVGRLNEFADERNRKSVADTLANIAAITGSVAQRSNKIQSIIDNAEAASGDLKVTMARIGHFSETADNLLQNDGSKFMAQASEAAQNINKLAGQLQQMSTESHGSVTAFTTNTLPEITRLVTDLRRLSDSLTRISGKLENNPSGFLFGQPEPEYYPEKAKK